MTGVTNMETLQKLRKVKMTAVVVVVRREAIGGKDE